MSNINTDTVRYYDYAAPYIVNEDASGYEDVDIDEFERFLSRLKKDYGDLVRVVSLVYDTYEEFTIPEPNGYTSLAGSTVEYIVQY